MGNFFSFVGRIVTMDMGIGQYIGKRDGFQYIYATLADTRGLDAGHNLPIAGLGEYVSSDCAVFR